LRIGIAADVVELVDTLA